MMINNLNLIELNSFIYKITTKNNAFDRNKITKDYDGETWFRYTKPNFTYSIEKYEVVGIIKPKVEGIWPDDDDFHPRFYIKNVKSKKLEISYLESDSYFKYRDSAAKYISEVEKKGPV